MRFMAAEYQDGFDAGLSFFTSGNRFATSESSSSVSGVTSLTAFDRLSIVKSTALQAREPMRPEYIGTEEVPAQHEKSGIAGKGCQ